MLAEATGSGDLAEATRTLSKPPPTAAGHRSRSKALDDPEYLADSPDGASGQSICGWSYRSLPRGVQPGGRRLLHHARDTRPRNVARARPTLTAPIPAIAATAPARSPGCQPSLTRERIPANRYVTGLSVATASSQPLMYSSGT
jgi:hypothetical protein